MSTSKIDLQVRGKHDRVFHEIQSNAETIATVRKHLIEAHGIIAQSIQINNLSRYEEYRAADPHRKKTLHEAMAGEAKVKFPMRIQLDLSLSWQTKAGQQVQYSLRQRITFFAGLDWSNYPEHSAFPNAASSLVAGTTDVTTHLELRFAHRPENSRVSFASITIPQDLIEPALKMTGQFSDVCFRERLKDIATVSGADKAQRRLFEHACSV